ncbi:hypothetical protein PSHT_14352 [Puccinia striiformis]|uniref:Uncharacterized protein n=1 Tax=Puccinia striiformis TaxID=27350 RepID=A0A2S4UKX9_9BASI|nr:hypothetical protein PSHT_14352 [Puccinia striiformis]
MYKRWCLPPSTWLSCRFTNQTSDSLLTSTPHLP